MKELMGFKSVALQMFQHTVTAKKSPNNTHQDLFPDSLTLLSSLFILQRLKVENLCPIHKLI